ncbi:MAG: hypothetical protein ASARMPRED_008913 [Alectoria sarmentosa]|nr:MAG: hypothetical protein ASARMPRED_008913 [Alectoria sarmentosa]
MTTSASRAMIATSAIFMALAIMAVVLRLHLRQKQKFPGSKADDWLIVAALTFSMALAVTNIVGVPVGGFGVPFPLLSDTEAQTFLKIVFVLQFWYILALGLVKLSILCLYGRLFSADRYPVVIKVFLVLTSAWLVSFIFATFFQVWPLSCNWVDCTPTTNYTVMYVCLSVTDVLLDIAILCIPTSFIRTLHISKGQKISLVGIFGLGVFCIIASIARLSYSVRYVQVNIEGNYQVNFAGPVVNMIMWSGIETCASTICANLPCYGPLLKRGPSLKYLFANIRSAFTSPRGLFSRRSSPKSTFQETTSTERLANEQETPRNRTTVEGGICYPRYEPDLELGKYEWRRPLAGDR